MAKLVNIREFRIENEAAMVDFANRIAAVLEPDDIILLDGDLGAGKSFFTRALIRKLGKGDETVPSPSFTLVQNYNLKTLQNQPIELYHFDLYRLEDAEEIWEIGWEEALETGANIVVVEWPCRLSYYRPENALNMLILADNNNSNIRHIHFPKETNSLNWQKRIKAL